MHNNLINRRGDFVTFALIGTAWAMAFINLIVCQGTAAMLTAVAIILLAIGTVNAVCTIIEQHRHEDNGPTYR